MLQRTFFLIQQQKRFRYSNKKKSGIFLHYFEATAIELATFFIKSTTRAE